MTIRIVRGYPYGHARGGLGSVAVTSFEHRRPTGSIDAWVKVHPLARGVGLRDEHRSSCGSVVMLMKIRWRYQPRRSTG